MRFTSVRLLVQFLILYLARRVLGRGIFRSRGIRYLTLGGVFAAFVLYCGVAYYMVGQWNVTKAVAETLLPVMAISVPVWVLAAYAVVRVLFLKADALLQLTFTLPMTNRERTFGFTVFEVLIIGVILGGLYSPVVVAFALHFGTDVVYRSLLAILFPVFTCYLIAGLGYQLLERLLLKLRVARARGVIVPTVLGLAMVVASNVTTEHLSTAIRAYREHREFFAPQQVYVWLDARFGPVFPTLLFVLAVGVLVPLIGTVAPRAYVPVKKYFRLLGPRLGRTHFGTRILLQVRSFEFTLLVGFVMILTLILVFTRAAGPPLILILLGFHGLYAFAESDPLRRTPPKSQTPFRDYLSMVLAQITVVCTVAVPITILLTIVAEVPLADTLKVVVWTISAIMCSTLVGIAFPAYHGNPFAPVVGSVIALTFLIVLGLALNLFNLPEYAQFGTLTAVNVLFAILGVVGVTQLERSRRYENAH